jgi:hypothetical protein
MTPPIDSAALKRVLVSLPPERPDPFPHLAHLSTDALLNRRVEITCQLKNLEQERQVIDGELQNTFSDAELRFGVRAPGGWMLKQRSRTSWEYAPDVRESIKALQQEAQPLTSNYLNLIQEST